jgi:hypothetical protein
MIAKTLAPFRGVKLFAIMAGTARGVAFQQAGVPDIPGRYYIVAGTNP